MTSLSDPDGPPPPGGFAVAAERRTGRLLGGLSRLLAIIGGLVLIALVVIVTLSVTGRALISFGLRPVPGDFELVEAGCAFAVFSFLPWCHFRRGHVTVDILMNAAPRALRNWLECGSNVVMTLVVGLLAWRFVLGFGDKLRYGETTFILQFPVWWAYLACLPGAFLAVAVAAYSVWRSANDAALGRV